jgi:hypothetical protein
LLLSLEDERVARGGGSGVLLSLEDERDTTSGTGVPPLEDERPTGVTGVLLSLEDERETPKAGGGTGAVLSFEVERDLLKKRGWNLSSLNHLCPATPCTQHYYMIPSRKAVT